MEPIELSYAILVPQGATAADGADAFMEYVEEHTNGKITFSAYYSNSLVPASEMLTATGSGIADMAGLSTALFPQELPIANWMLGLGALEKPQAPLGFIEDVLATYETYATSEDLAIEYEAQNLKVMSSVSTGMWGNICTSEAATPEQTEGMRVSTGGSFMVSDAEALGFIPGYLPSDEIYEALQRGIIDCQVNPSYVFSDLSVWDVAKHVTMAQWKSYPGFAQVINLDLWESLPDDAKIILEEAGIAFVEGYIDSTLEVYKGFVESAISEHGVTFHDPSALNAVLGAHQKAELETWPSIAPGSVADPDGFISDYEASLQGWQEVLLDLGVQDPTGLDLLDAASSGPSQPWQGAIDKLREAVAETE